MIFTAENTLLIGSILLFVSIVVGKTGYRFGVPTLLLFLVVGMLFGSDGLGLQFHDAKDAQFIGMVALSSFYRIIYLVVVRNELDEYLSAYHYFIVTGSHHVIYGLCFGICHPAFTENESET